MRIYTLALPVMRRSGTHLESEGPWRPGFGGTAGGPQSPFSSHRRRYLSSAQGHEQPGGTVRSHGGVGRSRFLLLGEIKTAACLRGC